MSPRPVAARAAGFSPWLRSESRRPADLVYWDGRIDDGGVPAERGADRATPTSIVRELLDRHGIQGLRRLLGDWSLVAKQWTTGTLLLARDFAGVRPLYYCVLRDGVAWSASLEALRERVQASVLDERYVAGFLSGHGCPHVTPYRDIGEVPAGCVLAITERGVSKITFWTEADIALVRCTREGDYDERLRGLLECAIAARLSTEGAAVAELSGGLDSSSVVSIASGLIKRGHVAIKRLITVSYLQENSPDTPFIRQVELACATRTIGLCVDDFPMFSPTHAAGATPTDGSPLQSAAAAIAREHDVSVFLTGQGGDLVFGNWLDDSAQVAASLRRFSPGGAARQAMAWSRVTGTPVMQILGKALMMVLPVMSRLPSRYADARHRRAEETSFTPAFAQSCEALQRLAFTSSDWMAAPVERRRHFHELMLARELNTLQPCSALTGIGYTHPLFDRRLVEFLMGIPADVLCRPGEPRRLMRRALRGILPEGLRTRRSKGLFTGAWLNAFKPLAAELRVGPTWQVVERGWIDYKNLLSRLERLLTGVDCNPHQLGQVLMFECWLRQLSQQRS